VRITTSENNNESICTISYGLSYIANGKRNDAGYVKLRYRAPDPKTPVRTQNLRAIRSNLEK
jgi:hypothetical protein